MRAPACVLCDYLKESSKSVYSKLLQLMESIVRVRTTLNIVCTSKCDVLRQANMLKCLEGECKTCFKHIVAPVSLGVMLAVPTS